MTEQNRRWVRWGVGFAVWTLLGLSFAARSYLAAAGENGDVPWRRIVTSNLVDFYVWGAASPLIFFLARKFNFGGERLPHRILLHLLFSVCFSFVNLAISVPVFWCLNYPDSARDATLADTFRNIIFNPYYLHLGLMIYWVTLIVAHALAYRERSRMGELRAELLAAQLADAQLRALKMQLHPHFLFNTLNSIASLLHQDIEAADKMVARLGDFLRLTLQNANQQTTPLAQELEFLRCYLEIERVRFQDRLSIEIDVDPRVLGAPVPNLIFQPLVENAVRHGVAQQPSPGRIEIRAHKQDGTLRVEIENSGPGLAPGADGSPREGVGLTNTRARLARLYGSNYRLDLADAPSGVVATVDIPLPNGGKQEELAISLCVFFASCFVFLCA